jgi:hypothetical protein
MPKGFQKGVATNPNGRKAGVPNKNTQAIKDAYQLLIENNLDNLKGWLEKIAEKDPEKAIRIISDLSEYIIPKLARKEHVGEDGGPIVTKLIFEDSEE